MQYHVVALENDQDIIREYTTTGSNSAATSFVRKYQNFVYSTALRYMASHDDADDVTQEVFIKALRNLKKFKGNSSLKTWLYRITVNQSLNMKRKKSVFSFLGMDDDLAYNKVISETDQPDTILEGKELEERFMNALASLPDKQRETFALRYFDNMTYDEISDMIGTSVGGLKANYYQAVKKLGKFLKDENDR